MSRSAKLRRAPLRLATGAYILNTGITKLSTDDETAKSLHGMASGTYPVLSKLEPKVFARGLAVGEIAVGTMLLLPIVPPFIAGAALSGFSGALINMYWHTPGMHHEGSLRPTPQGTAISKDVWMLGIGLALMTDAALEGTREGVDEIEATVDRMRAEMGEQARRLARRPFQARRRRRGRIADAGPVKRLSQRAGHASEATAQRLAAMRAQYGPIAADKARTTRDAVRDAAAQYGPIAADKARMAGEAARDAAAQYGPAATEKMKAAGHATQEYATRARERLAS